MSQPRVAAGPDRLPWLSDEVRPEQRRGGRVRELAGWVVAGLFAVAAGSYWAGVRSGDSGVPSSPRPAATATALLPPPAPAPGQPDLDLPSAPEVAIAPAPEVAVPDSHRVRHRSAGRAAPAPSPSSDDSARSASAPPATPAPLASIKDLTLWPASKSAGAAGRIVRIGAFGSRDQAKLGWRHMVGAYPAVGRLPATVVTDRNSHGRTFYRFQIGTTSQAHSEVLCQRMQWIGMSCAVVGLAQKPQGIER